MNTLQNKKALHRKAFPTFPVHFFPEKVNYVNTRRGKFRLIRILPCGKTLIRSIASPLSYCGSVTTRF